MRKTVVVLFSILMMASMLLSACTPAPAAPAAPAATAEPAAPAATEAPAEPAAPAATEAPAPEPTATTDPNAPMLEIAAPMEGRTQIYWYIGLGAGSQPEQIPVEKAFCDKFNASQDKIQLIPIIIDNKYARDNLTAQLAAGNAPDIVGPVGTAGRAAFPGAFADLEPLIKEANYDTSDIDPKFLEFYKDQGKMVGLPFAIFPEAVFYNKALFDEAELAYPPQKFGEKYMLDGQEVEWNFETLAKIAKILTVDKNGNDATSPDFDRANIVQYGYHAQWSDSPRAVGSLFGAALPIDEAGNAVMPENWTKAFKWYWDGEFGPQPFIPSQAAIDGDLLKGNAFSSGKLALATTHLWYTCCIDAKNVPSWDVAVMPSYEGKVTSKMHGDTFAIMAGSKHPKEAFEVYKYMLGEGSADLYALYGGLPARTSQQAAFFEGLDKKFAPNKVNWQVFIDSIPYMDVPNHELYIPNYAKAFDLFATLGSDIRSNDKLDMDARLAQFVTDLDKIFKEVK